jgi:hypothetical protein
MNRFWKWTTQVRPHWRVSKTEAAIMFCVFGVTGSSSMFFVRPALHSMGLEGSMVDGPNSYRVLSLCLISPIYAMLLVTIGTLVGRHTYFASMSQKIIGRFLPRTLREKVGCRPALEKARLAKSSAS